MNNKKIEILSILKLKETIAFHPLLEDYINDNDKEPSWDGSIYTYKNMDLKAEHIDYQIPVQVKGRNDPSLLKRERITYPVEYKHLRNYYNNGGVCYFVIVISDDGRDRVIFYNNLTPIKLKDYLKDTENKGADQTKSIPLQRLMKDEPNELYLVLMQFGHDSKCQGNSNAELTRKAISLFDLKDIDSMRMTAYVSSIEDISTKIREGEICIYGHRTDFDIWLPLDYSEQKKLHIDHIEKYQSSIRVDGINYYESFMVRSDDAENVIMQLSDNIWIDIKSHKLNFCPVSVLPEVMKDIKFIHALEYGHEFFIDKKAIKTFSNIRIPSKLLECFDILKEMIRIFDKFDVQCTKRLDMFTQKDWKAVNILLNIDRGNIYPKNDYAWYIWCWNNRVYPIFLTKGENGKLDVINATKMNKYSFYLTYNKNEYRVALCLLYKRDIWEKLYDVSEETLMNQIENIEFNCYTEGYISVMFVELLAAYDSTHNEKYYNISKFVAEKLLTLSPDNESWKLNRYQLIKRKRDLNEVELQEIEKIDEKANLDVIKCAANILLDNKRQARKILENLSKDERTSFKQFPIYNLL